MTETEKQTAESLAVFRKKVWTVIAIAALVVIVLWILKAIFNVLLLTLAGALIAIFYSSLSGLIQRKLSLSQGVSLAISIAGTLILVALFFWLAGYKIQQQVTELSKTLPQTVEQFKSQLNQSPLGQQILQQTSGNNMRKFSTAAQSFFRTTFGVLGDLYVLLFISIFFTVSPKIYIDGFLKLIPPKGKSKAQDVVDKTGETLKKWLKGKLLAMLIVAVLSYIGLVIIGVPMALVLALIAGILNFIPNFGPLIALIPALLVGFMHGTTTALLIAGLYILIQTIESNLITPQIEKKMVKIPPAMVIISQLIMGVLTGGWGLVLASPLMAILIVVLDELYVKKQQTDTIAMK